ncbi:MAG: hypothetical protein SF097_28200 [Acidobacteriota bacterium]|nr:hypothetical protein [Acidobacteriota bacterium]
MSFIKTTTMLVDASAPMNSGSFAKPAINLELNVRSSQLLIPVLLIIGVFYLLTIRQGHQWGDDFSMYIQHAQNIAEGASYHSTSYIYLPPYVGPASYPPICPLVLAPVVWLFGLNLTAMKAELILVFLLGLFVLAKIAKEFLPANWQLALIALVGLNPYFWETKDLVESEPVFYLMVYLSVFVVLNSYNAIQAGASRLTQLGYALATGLSFYLAYGTRSIGIVLVPSLVFFDLIRNRKLSLPSLYAVGSVLLAIGLIVLQAVLLRSDRTYVESVNTGSESFLRDWMQFALNNVPLYTASLTQIWDNGYSKLARLALTMVMSGLAVVGFVAQLRKRITFIEVFVALYTVCVVIAPMDGGIRYLLPVVPFFIFYALQGIRLLMEQQFFKAVAFRGGRTVALGGLAAAITLTYVLGYTVYNFREIPNGISGKDAVEFFDYVNRQTAQTDVLIFGKPRALGLFTGRRGSFYPVTKDDQVIWNYFRKINATHIVSGPLGIEPTEDEFLTGFLNRNRSHLREEFSKTTLKVYRIVDIPGAELSKQPGELSKQ